MCGICGKINFNSSTVDENIIRSMTDALIHRGPDDAGIYIKANVGLGHRRLSIIDLSHSAHQPMPNGDGSIWIVYNGEIYNFQELRKDLEEHGYLFRSKSDTEVILHLYEEKGVDCVRFLRGMFAFAIWDENKKRLFLARDRIGKKPLNYAFNNSGFIFASEIKSILQDTGFYSEINLKAIDRYLTYQYIPAPETIFLRIKKLPPAHILILENGKVKIEKYWHLSYQNNLKMKEEDYCEKIKELFTESCKIRLISDVPLGAFLSGGIDSSAVVAMMSNISNKPVKTFSIGFEECSFDELPYARKIANLFQTEHYEYIVRPNALEVLPELIQHFGEPFADSSAIPTYYLSKMTRQEVTVALNGDGGDELFAGYERYVANKLAGIYDLMPPYLRKITSSFLQVFPESTDKRDFVRYLKRFTKGSYLPKDKRYAFWISIFDKTMKDALYTDDFKNRIKEIDAGDYICDAFKNSDADDFINAALFVDTTTYLPNDLLVKVDIASMANSLEARSPFLDHKLIEFVAAMPSDMKLKGITTKYILKKIFKDILPKEILYRRKEGFGVPIGSWFRNELKKYAYDTLLSNTCIKRGYFRKDVLKRLLDEHGAGRADHSHRIWSLVNLELWQQMFVDSSVLI